MKKSIILGLVLIVTLILIFKSAPGRQTVKAPNPTGQTTQPQGEQNESPKIVSTKPDPLDNTIIPADGVIEFTFNKPLQNAPEFKIRIEPKVEFKVDLSQDRKTAKIIPTKAYELGATYTLTINPDTKFEGFGDWRESKSFHFRIIKYRGV